MKWEHSLLHPSSFPLILCSSTGFDGDLLGFAFGGLGDGQGQHAVVIAGIDLVLVDPGRQGQRLEALALFAKLAFLLFGFLLVVDDEHLVRIMLQLGLERHGFGVWLAANSREAIELYRAHREDITLVLLDVQMPGLDGPHTLDALRELDPDVRACFMSGDTGTYTPEELRQQGAACLIAKPFFLGDLANILRRVAHGVPTDLLPAGVVGQR